MLTSQMLFSHITLRTKSSVFLVSIGLIFASTTIAFSAPVSTNSGYNFCVNNKTKIVSYTQAKQCPIGSTLINVGKQGVAGFKGIN